MAKNRYLNTKFWDDSYIIKLDPIEKLIFIYSLTNPLTSICGIYEISLKRIAFDTGIDKEMLIKIFHRFEKDSKIKYLDGWIAIKNFIKHQAVNPNIIKSINNEITLVPIPLLEWIMADKNNPFEGFERVDSDEKNKSNPLDYLNLYNLNLIKSNTKKVEKPNNNYLSKEKLIEFWNVSVKGNIPKLKSLDDDSYKKYKLRVDEGMDITKIFEMIRKSKFLQNGSDNQAWKFNFRWLISNQKNWLKVIEGNYSDIKKTSLVKDDSPTQIGWLNEKPKD